MGGVVIKNCTAVPLKIQLRQVGVLYHGVVQPGECFVRETGAVHFTICATVSEEDDTDWKDTVLPVVKVVVGSFVTLATGGLTIVGAGASAAVAAGTGAAATGAAVTAGAGAGAGGGGGGTIAVKAVVAMIGLAKGVLKTTELVKNLAQQAKQSHCYISSAGWYFGGENELEIHGGPQILADSKGVKYRGSPLYIVDKNNKDRHS